MLSGDGIECQQMQRVEMDDWPVFMEPSCETLFMCFITTFKEGIRAGGGISDVLRKPASHVSDGGRGESVRVSVQRHNVVSYARCNFSVYRYS